MAENSENIEAKLCAYVEGDLDESARVEIEKHLEAHPNHRRLLAELSATRDLLRFLPRESAPPELAETFNAQLERSALLDGPGIDSGTPTLRGNLLPRILAMAAIVILAAGLGVIVYVALPQGDRRTQLALPSSAASRPTDDGSLALRSLREPARTPPTERLAKAGPPSGTPSAAVASPSVEDLDASGRADRMSKASASAAPPDAELDSLATDSSAPETRGGVFGRRLSGKDRSGPAADRVYVIVSARNPSDAVRDVTTNLSLNSIAWEPAHEPAPGPPQSRQGQLARNSARANSSYVQVELDNALKKRQTQQLRAQQQNVQQQQLATRAESDAHIADEQATAEETRQRDALADLDIPAVDDAGTEAEAKGEFAGSDTTATQVEEVSPDAAEQQAAPNQPAPAQVAQTDEVSDASEVAGIVAYGMTRQQVMELGRVLNRADRQVELIADDTELQVANESLQQMRAGQDSATALRGQQPSPPAAAPAPLQESEEQLTDRAAGASREEVAKAPAAPKTARRNVAMKDGSLAERTASRSTTAPIARRTPSARPATRPASQGQALAGTGGSSAGVLMRHGKGGQPVRIRAGMRLSVTVDELAGPDMDKTTEVSVSDTGEIELPLIDPIPIEGLTRSQTETKIAEAYKSAGVIDTPTVTVEPVDTPPALTRRRTTARSPVTKPAVQEQHAYSARLPALPSSDSSLQEAAPAPAATAPHVTTTAEASAGEMQESAAAAETQRSDELLDVLILVQRDPAAEYVPVPDTGEEADHEPTTTPATQQNDAPDAPVADETEQPEE